MEIVYTYRDLSCNASR